MGDCNRITGLCECRTGFAGQACDRCKFLAVEILLGVVCLLTVKLKIYIPFSCLLPVLLTCHSALHCCKSSAKVCGLCVLVRHYIKQTRKNIPGQILHGQQNSTLFPLYSTTRSVYVTPNYRSGVPIKLFRAWEVPVDVRGSLGVGWESPR